MQLETQRLILRPFTEGDAQDVYDYAKDPRVGPAAGWKPHESVEESREIIRTVFSEPDVFAVVDKESGKVIGSAGFTGRHRKELPDPDDEIGYSLHLGYWGRGLMPEAVAELLRYGFEDRKLATIWCDHYDGNQKSKRVISKSGFTFRFLRMQKVPTYDNATRLALCYAMTREEWQKRREEQA